MFVDILTFIPINYLRYNTHQLFCMSSEGSWWWIQCEKKDGLGINKRYLDE